MNYPKDLLLQVNLTQSTTYKDFVQFLHNIVVYEDGPKISKAQDFFQQWYTLHPNFKEQYPDRAAKIDELLVDGRWMALQVLTADQVKELFQKHLKALFLIQDKYNISAEENIVQEVLVGKFPAFMVAFFPLPQIEERDNFKKELKDIILSNEEALTSASFYGKIRLEQPTAKAWFKSYIEFVGIFSTENKQDYFFKVDQNFQRLTTQEQHNLKILFNLYEHLGLSSATPIGLEEPIPLGDDGKESMGVLQYGKFQYYDQIFNDEQKIMFKQIKQLIKETVPEDNTAAFVLARPPVDRLGTVSMATQAATQQFGPDHFTDTDAAEVETLRATSLLLGVKGPDYAADVNSIKQKLSLTFSDSAKGKQFAEGVESALRGVRNPQELTHYLEKLGLTILQISQTVFEVKKLLAEREQANKPKPADVERLKPTFADVKKTMIRNDKPAAVPAVDNVGRDAINRVSTMDADQSETVIRQSAFLPKLRRPKRQRKPMIDDIKLQQSMVMGPIDELRAMDVIEFRRLATDPATAALKIKDKINLLAEESIDKQTEGIKAFKESPLNHLYLDIGSKSITTNQSVAEVITNLQAQTVATLTVPEFNAISDLNQQLRF